MDPALRLIPNPLGNWGGDDPPEDAGAAALNFAAS